VLGQHPGIAYYTVGQRRRLGISAPEPLYVQQIDAPRNSITVTTGNDPSRFAREVVAAHPNWIDRARLSEPIAVSAKIRYNMVDQPAVLSQAMGEEFRVRFEEPQRAVTPGQAVVCYRGEIVVGGGVIRSANTGVASQSPTTP
jgi:tRNA-specific 2-thiouridylase